MSYGEFRERANFDLGSSNFEVPITGTSPIFGPGFDLTRISQRLNVASGAIDPVTKLALGPALYAAAGTPYQRIVLDTAAPNVYNSSQSTFTEELQVQGQSTDGRLNFVLGGYLEFSRPIGFNAGRTGIFLDCTRPQNLECANPLFFGSISESHTKLSFDNHGIFGQATYNFTDQLALTAGARYTFDKIKGLQDSTRASFSANAGTGPLFADPLTGVMIARACTDSFRHGPLALALAGLSPPDADRSVCTTNLTNKSNKPTWVINLDYKPTPDILLYAKYARGYRQGGLNFTNPGLERWSPEKLDTFEVGAKTSFRGTVSGYFNVTGFYNKLSDQQIFGGIVADPATGVSGGAAIINAGKSRSYGAEVDASALLFDSLRFDLGYTYLNSKIQELDISGISLDGTPFIRITPRALPGQPFNLSPEHKLTLTGTYTLPLDESLGKLDIGVTWTHTSSFFTDQAAPASINGLAAGRTPAVDLLNVNVSWNEVGGSPIDLAFFATNVTKEKYPAFGPTGWQSNGYADVSPALPRMYGVRLRFNFGQ